ncbi:hypothetical protein AVEN_120492-1 [Araneus ventricosus]|uniref:Uncharacterized protein n=1 Tax=Araneus ventricosus TaxID=182803 RepID=A0A4Y2MKC9_ARAVE|nr:hypothetical protein AVEN_120492-1 [Araneus ventricosus]
MPSSRIHFSQCNNRHPYRVQKRANATYRRVLRNGQRNGHREFGHSPLLQIARERHAPPGGAADGDPGEDTGIVSDASIVSAKKL